MPPRRRQAGAVPGCVRRRPRSARRAHPRGVDRRSRPPEPWVVRVTVDGGPVALGNAEWRALDEGDAWDTIGVPLEQLHSRGFVRADVDVVTATALVNAAINEAAPRHHRTRRAGRARALAARPAGAGRGLRRRELRPSRALHRRHLRPRCRRPGSPLSWFPPESAEQLQHPRILRVGGRSRQQKKPMQPSTSTVSPAAASHSARSTSTSDSATDTRSASGSRDASRTTVVLS